jgi:hypothetical protein
MNHSTSSTAEVKNDRVIPPLPLYVFMSTWLTVFCLAAYYSQDWFQIFEEQVLWRTGCEGRVPRSCNLPTRHNIWTRRSLSSVKDFVLAKYACSL